MVSLDGVKHLKTENIMIHLRENMPSNSESFALELMEDIEEISPRYYIDSDMLTAVSKSSPHTCTSIYYLFFCDNPMTALHL